MISLMSSPMMKLNQHLTSRRRPKRDAHHGWTKLLIHIGKSKTDRTGTFAFRYAAGYLRWRCSDIAGKVRRNHRNRTMHGKSLMMSSATRGPISGTSTTPRAHFWPEVYNQLNRFIRLVYSSTTTVQKGFGWSAVLPEMFVWKVLIKNHVSFLAF